MKYLQKTFANYPLKENNNKCCICNKELNVLYIKADKKYCLKDYQSINIER